MEKFSEAENQLCEAGYEVINPAALMEKSAKVLSYDEVMKLDLMLVEMSDALYMLSGWQKSKGAWMEHQRACLQQKIIFYEDLESEVAI
jgi:hypothetical protein